MVTNEAFDLPRHPAGMQAMLADSVQNYGPLPSELRLRRRRTSSRPSPYPAARAIKVSISPESVRSFSPAVPQIANDFMKNVTNSPLQPKSINSNTVPTPKAKVFKKAEAKQASVTGTRPFIREDAFGVP
ncbi:hypothetical protein MPER_05205 [Moniliophthora perniciosa FA553]|nr:hypothetical protein MPER_05205 [Moniliophthora perniciosa FA553]